MLKNLLSTVQQYADEHKRLEDEFTLKQQQIKEWYKGDMYKEQLDKAKEAYRSGVEALRARAKPLIEQEVNEAKTAIKSVITKPVTGEQLNLIQTAKLLNESNMLSDVEKKEIMSKCKNNYLATRMLVDLFGLEYSPAKLQAEGLLSRIDGALKLINKNVIEAQGFNTERSSFTSAFVLQGDVINDIQSDVSVFVSSFSDGSE